MIEPHDNPDATTHFGYRDVPVGEKQKLVGRVFTSVAAKYDLMNDLMSLGVHRIWKRWFVETSGVRNGDRVLDLAGGTGDIAALLLARVGSSGSVVLGDINAAMLRAGRDRLLDRGFVRNLDYAQLNAEALPFPDATFDAVTIAFGLRNVTDKALALREMRRVLKPGGRALVLEFSAVQSEWLKPLYEFHSFQVLPRLQSDRLAPHPALSPSFDGERGKKHCRVHLSETVREAPAAGSPPAIDLVRGASVIMRRIVAANLTSMRSALAVRFVLPTWHIARAPARSGGGFR